ncbi:hypothetical protein PA7078_05765 [Pseudomonas aeruginosa]
MPNYAAWWTWPWITTARCARTLLDIEAARAQYRIQRADRVPGLNAAATGNRQRQPADLSAGNRSEVASSYQVGLALPEYELDLFGRVKSLTDAALQQYLASEEAARAARIALVAEVSQAYLSYDGALRRLALTRQTLVSREYSFALIDQRRAAGAATALDYQEALGLVEQARAEQERNLRQKQQAFNALVLLLGSDDAAQAIPRSPGQRPKLLQDIAPGTPSELIERRPDILAAEHRLRARNADIGAARAAFFPRISLTGSFGTSSAEMSGLFDGGSRSWSFLPTLTLPIFDGGRNRANLSLAEARKDSAVAAYEGTIQNRFPRGRRRPGGQRYPASRREGPARPGEQQQRSPEAGQGTLREWRRQPPALPRCAAQQLPQRDRLHRRQHPAADRPGRPVPRARRRLGRGTEPGGTSRRQELSG